MNDYLSNLAAIVVHPGGGVQPRLPGRFETQHLALIGPFDLDPSHDAELTSTIDAGHDEPALPAKSARSSGDLVVLSACAPTRVDRPRDPSAPPLSPPPPGTGSRALATQSPPHGTKVARPWIGPGMPAESEGMSLAVQPTKGPPAVEKEKRPAAPGGTGPISPIPTPDTPLTNSRKLRPTEKRRPVPPLSDERQPARSRPSAAAPAIPSEVRPASAPEPPASVRSVTPDVDPVARGSMPHITASRKAHRQIEPAAPRAGIGPAASQAAPRPSGEPILGWAGGGTVVEPHFTKPIADVPLPQARANQSPTIRVTIGRVEVRAITPPAPPAARPKPARTGPVLSLDDYLKQRSRGQR